MEGLILGDPEPEQSQARGQGSGHLIEQPLGQGFAGGDPALIGERGDYRIQVAISQGAGDHVRENGIQIAKLEQHPGERVRLATHRDTHCVLVPVLLRHRSEPGRVLGRGGLRLGQLMGGVEADGPGEREGHA